MTRHYLEDFAAGQTYGGAGRLRILQALGTAASVVLQVLGGLRREEGARGRRVRLGQGQEALRHGAGSWLVDGRASRETGRAEHGEEGNRESRSHACLVPETAARETGGRRVPVIAQSSGSWHCRSV